MEQLRLLRNNGPSQAVIALASGSSTIVQGQSTTLSWKATNAVSFSISPAVAAGTLPLTGSATVSPAATTTYVATAMDANGKAATNSITVTVVPQGSAPTMTLSVSPGVVAAGQTYKSDVGEHECYISGYYALDSRR